MRRLLRWISELFRTDQRVMACHCGAPVYVADELTRDYPSGDLHTCHDLDTWLRDSMREGSA